MRLKYICESNRAPGIKLSTGRMDAKRRPIKRNIALKPKKCGICDKHINTAEEYIESFDPIFDRRTISQRGRPGTSYYRHPECQAESDEYRQQYQEKKKKEKELPQYNKDQHLMTGPIRTGRVVRSTRGLS